MNPIRRRKLLAISLIAMLLTIAAALVLYALKQNINLFYAPTQVAEGRAPLNHPIRLGGMVVKGSVLRGRADLHVHFQLTDFKHTVAVDYEGILPDLFREGQGIVALGRLVSRNQFIASEVLAKHDENYMPPEIRQALKESP